MVDPAVRVDLVVPVVLPVPEQEVSQGSSLPLPPACPANQLAPLPPACPANSHQGSPAPLRHNATKLRLRFAPTAFVRLRGPLKAKKRRGEARKAKKRCSQESDAEACTGAVAVASEPVDVAAAEEVAASDSAADAAWERRAATDAAPTNTAMAET